MRRTFVTMVTAAIMIAGLIGMPSSASAQVVVIIGNGATQPYYPQPFPYPFPQPFPRPHVVLGGPAYYPGYGYAAAGNGYYNGYHNSYYGNAYYQPYGYGW